MCLIYLCFISLFDIRLPEDDLRKWKHVGVSVDCTYVQVYILIHEHVLLVLSNQTVHPCADFITVRQSGSGVPAFAAPVYSKSSSPCSYGFDMCQSARRNVPAGF
jgi:hypothetical protein